MRRLLIAAVLGASALAGAAAAQSGPISVEIDHSTRVQLRGAAGSVIVGNPAIADVTVVDANTLFVTGKGYGVTEIVAVDQIGRTLFHGEVVVSAPAVGQVRVWRGGALTEMACAASCAPTLRSPNGASAAAPAPNP